MNVLKKIVSENINKQNNLRRVKPRNIVRNTFTSQFKKN